MELKQSEINARLEANDPEVIYALANGEMRVIPEDAEEVAVEEETTEVVDDEPVDPMTVIQESIQEESEPVKEEEDDLYLDMIKQVKEENQSNLDKVLKENEELRNQMKTSDERYQDLLKKMESRETEHTQQPSLSLNEDEDDIELASTYSKNNRQLIQSLRDEIRSLRTQGPASQQELYDKIEKLEVAELERDKLAKQEDERRSNEREQEKVFTEVETFIKGNERFKLNKSVKDRYEDHLKMRGEIEKYLGTSTPEIVTRAIYGVVYGESDKYKKLRDQMTKSGIEIPEDTKAYLELSEMVDLKNGLQLDRKTGKYEELKGDDGRPVHYRNLGEVYKLSDFYEDDIVKARREQTQAIASQLDSRSQSPTVLPESVLHDQTSGDTITPDEKNRILSMSKDDIRKNPELMKKFETIMSEINGLF